MEIAIYSLSSDPSAMSVLLSLLYLSPLILPLPMVLGIDDGMVSKPSLWDWNDGMNNY
jgi:hypothetical protein